MNYTEIEVKVREATNKEAWGASSALMTEIAKATYSYDHLPEVMNMLWKRMLTEKNWRHTYKVCLRRKGRCLRPSDGLKHSLFFLS